MMREKRAIRLNIKFKILPPTLSKLSGRALLSASDCDERTPQRWMAFSPETFDCNERTPQRREAFAPETH